MLVVMRFFLSLEWEQAKENINFSLKPSEVITVIV